MSDPIIISAFARTPMGGLQGALAPARAVELGAVAVRAAVERARVDRSAVERILPAGQGQAPARQAALGAGLPRSVEATTVNKMCGSGRQAAIMASEALSAGTADLIVAGGMECMTNAPYVLQKRRSGVRIGHDRIIDTMMMDGLEGACEAGRPMGSFAKEAAWAYQFSRADQEAYALESLRHARHAIATGAFAELTPVTIAARSGPIVVDQDEQPGLSKPGKIASLRPAFAPDGAITPATSASISDGAAALVLTGRSVADAKGLAQAARLAATAGYVDEPALFTTAPAFAIRKVLAKAGWTLDQADLFEINEAVAAVAMIAMRDLGIPHERLNVNGGATALGHPIGASGARIIATLIAALQARSLRRGVAALCMAAAKPPQWRSN